MSPASLHILIAAPAGGGTKTLLDQLALCRRPHISVRIAHTLSDASSAAASDVYDLMLLDVRLVPGVGRKVVGLSPSLLALPILLTLDRTTDDVVVQNLPEWAVDYIARESDDAPTLERLLSYAARQSSTLRSLEDAEAQLRSIVESISDGILIVDDDEDVVFANPAAEGILHRPLQEIIGRPAGFKVPAAPDGHVEVLSHRHDALQLDVSVASIHWEGRDAQLVSFRDVTAQQALEHNLRRTADEAERVAKLKTAFLANMSHELRMPLASIIGFAQLIREGMENEEFIEFADSIIQGGNRLLETITSVLDLTRLDADAIQAHSRLVGAAAVAREAVGMLGALASRKNLPVEIQAPDEDDTVFADPTILRRILNNLIGNAIKFTDSGYVRVEIEADDQIVRIHVVDTGCGIDEAFLPSLFEEFTQESSGYDRSHEGSGLGLAITKRLCRLIGGRIDVESEKGVGSTFTVTLPHVDPDDPEPRS